MCTTSIMQSASKIVKSLVLDSLKRWTRCFASGRFSYAPILIRKCTRNSSNSLLKTHRPATGMVSSASSVTTVMDLRGSSKQTCTVISKTRPSVISKPVICTVWRSFGHSSSTTKAKRSLKSTPNSKKNWTNSRRLTTSELRRKATKIALKCKTNPRTPSLLIQVTNGQWKAQQTKISLYQNRPKRRRRRRETMMRRENRTTRKKENQSATIAEEVAARIERRTNERTERRSQKANPM